MLLDVVRVVAVVPELGHEEDLGAGNAGFLDGVADGGLGAVDAGGVDVAVAGFEGGEDGGLLGVLVLPGAEAEGWNVGSVVVSDVVAL